MSFPGQPSGTLNLEASTSESRSEHVHPPMARAAPPEHCGALPHASIPVQPVPARLGKNACGRLGCLHFQNRTPARTSSRLPETRTEAWANVIMYINMQGCITTRMSQPDYQLAASVIMYVNMQGCITTRISQSEYQLDHSANLHLPKFKSVSRLQMTMSTCLHQSYWSAFRFA